MDPLPSPPCPPPPTAQREAETDQASTGRLRPGSDLLEEVLLAVDAPGPGEAPVSQLHLAVCTLEAGAVPVSVQDLQDELVQDVLVAASALGDLCGERRERRREPSAQHRSPDGPRVDAFPFPPCPPRPPVVGEDRTQPPGLPRAAVQAVHCTETSGQGG